jgi:RND family efflux transporter MFP subunit
VTDEDRLADELASLRIDRADRHDRRDGVKTGVARTDGRRSGTAGWVVAALVLGLLTVAGFYVFREGQGRIFPDEVELGSVSLMSPAQADVTLVATGYVQARHKATVAPRTTGRLSRLYVDEGDPVKEGQLLAELESADAQAQLAQVRADIAAARAKVERARADLDDAQVKLDREDALLKRGAGTQSAFDDARTRLASAKAQLAAAEADQRAVEARHQAASVTLENTRVKSPFGGTVTRKLAEIGEVIPPGGTGLLTIADLHDLEVQADVSESQFAKVKVGTPSEILLDAFPDKRFRGEVWDIRRTVDRAKAAVTVKVKFTDDAQGVLPDMAAKVSFLTRKLDDQALKAAPKVVVPADAIVTRGGQKLLYTVEDDRIKSVAIAPGDTVGQMIELKSGPSPGTRVIRHPDDRLHDGSAVKEKKK